MPSAWIVTSIAAIIISVLAGLIFYSVINSGSTTAKKKQLEEVVSLIINFVIYIWVGKIFINFSTFITDPLAVLAYPSNSSAFYIAVFLLVVNIIYNAKRKKQDALEVLYTITPIFLASVFVYEFIQLIWKDNTFSWGHLSLAFLLLVLYLGLYEKLNRGFVVGVVFAGWALGQLILTLFLPFTTLFGYMMARWFLFVIVVVSVGYSFYFFRKRVD